MGSEPVTGKSGLTRQAAAYGLGVITLLNFVNDIHRYVLPVAASRIKDALSLIDTELGFLCQSRSLSPQGLIRGLMCSAPGVKPPGGR